MDEKQFYTIIIRHDSSTKWAVNNPILAYGEYAVEDDTHRVKRGDGETEWNSLPYEDFGLNYIVTYANLSGDVADNPQLVEELDKKLSISVLGDIGYTTVANIEITNENETIGKITKYGKNVNTGVISSKILYIKSTDQSLQGYWSVDDAGAKILNLSAKMTIEDYKPGKVYHKDYICYYKNRIYRALEDFEAERDFNYNHWVAICSTHAEDILYNNYTSGLNSENVQDAIDETNRRIDNRVLKTDEGNMVYGTTNNGTQTVIPIMDLSSVHSVNNKRPTADKNIQLDANDIYYEDSHRDKGTIKEVLDSKLDNTFAGRDNLLVQNLQFNYNQNTGYLECVEEKVSTVDGSHSTERVEINVVSEEELRGEVLALNNAIGVVELNLNNRITGEVDTLNGRIDEEKLDLEDLIELKYNAMDEKKIDKDIAVSLVTGAEVITQSTFPTIKFTNKNTGTKEVTYDYVHFVTNGEIKVKVTDEDHIVIDSTDIDNLNTEQNNRLASAENRLNANDINIASLMEHDSNHDRLLLAHTQQIAHQETRILALEGGLETANSNIELEASNRIAEDEALSGRITTNALNITSKVDKSFAGALDNKVLGKIESDEIVNTEILNLKETFVSPYDGSLSNGNIKVISSNGTIVADRLTDGTIDLTANVNLDVNYYITSETISDIIANETTIHLNTLTPSGRTLHPGRDVISDSNNTYGRVQSVDLDSGTCIVVTYQKSTQIVWGNIGGTLANQVDLKSVLDIKLESVNGKSTTAQSKSIVLDASDINVDETVAQKISVKNKLENLDIGKVDITLEASKLYGTDNQGNATVYSIDELQPIQTVNGVSPDRNKEVTIGTSDITSVDMLGDTTTLALVIGELQDIVAKLKVDLQEQIQAYATGTDYAVSGNYTAQRYVTLNNGVSILMAKVLRDFTSNNTEATIIDSFIYDVEHDNLQLIGIPGEIVDSN